MKKKKLPYYQTYVMRKLFNPFTRYLRLLFTITRRHPRARFVKQLLYSNGGERRCRKLEGGRTSLGLAQKKVVSNQISVERYPALLA